MRYLAGKPFDLLRAVSGSARLTAMNLPNGFVERPRPLPDPLPCLPAGRREAGAESLTTVYRNLPFKLLCCSFTFLISIGYI